MGSTTQKIMDKSDIAQLIVLIMIMLPLEMLSASVLCMVREISESEIEKCASKLGEKCTAKLLRAVPKMQGFEVNAYIGLVMLNTIVGGLYFPKFFIWSKIFSDYISGLFEASFIFSDGIWMGSFILMCVLFMIAFFTFGCLIPRKLVLKLGLKRTGKLILFGMQCSCIFKPFAFMATILSSLILNIMGYKRIVDEPDITEEEILSVVNEGHEQGVLEESEVAMISNIIEFGDKEAKDIMTNRNNIIGIDLEMPFRDALELMYDEKKSRYPVFEENMDQIAGILNLKDAVVYARKAQSKALLLKDVDDLFREAVFVPETMKIDRLFHEMKRDKLQMVIVVDEYGQTSGLVAMEDILEEIVGDILDEYDEEEEYIEETGHEEYEIDGLTPLEDLEKQFSIRFESQEYETLNGFLISKLEHIPEEREDFELEFAGYYFRILKVENRMIKSVLVKKLTEPNSTDLDIKDGESESTVKEVVEEEAKK